MAKPGRPKGSKNRRRKKRTTPEPKKLRLKACENIPCSEGDRVSGVVDQYGRVMRMITNERGDTDITPSGVCAKVTH